MKMRRRMTIAWLVLCTAAFAPGGTGAEEKDPLDRIKRPQAEVPQPRIPMLRPDPTCPRGWHVAPGSRRTSGAYECAPDRPEQIRCPEGTVWHVWSDCIVGCLEAPF